MKAALLGVFRRNCPRGKNKGTESPDDSGEPPKMMSTNGELGSLVDFNKKASAATIINKINNASYASSSEKMMKSSSSSSEKMVKSSSSSSSTSSSSLLSKKAQILHSTVSTQELKQQQQAQQQNEMFQENRNFCRSVSVTSNSSTSSDSRLKMVSNSTASQGLVSTGLVQRGLSVDEPLDEEELVLRESSPQEMKFEQKRISASSKMKVSTSDGYTAEKMAATNQERKRLQTGSVSYEEKSASAAMKQKLETDGFSAEKVAAVRQDQVQLKTADSIQQQQRTATAASMKLSTDEFTAEKIAMSKQEERHLFSQGMVQAEKNMSSSSSAKMTFTSKGVSRSSISSQNIHQVDFGNMSSLGMSFGVMPGDSIESFGFNENQKLAILQGLEEDVQILSDDSSSSDVDKAKLRFESRMITCVEKLKTALSVEEATTLLMTMSDLFRKAWAVPNYGHDLGTRLCNIMRERGGLKIIVDNCSSENADLQFRSAELLEQCMSTENRTYVVQNGLQKVVKVACSCSNKTAVSHSRVGTGLLEHLFKHSESTCSEVIRRDGLKSIIYKCRTSDVETLRHCATALANLSLYGGPENQEAMIKHEVPVWLFTLAFNNDDNIKYYACLAISSLVANKEIEAAVLKSGTLDLVEPFVTSHSPEEFAKSHVGHVHGQSKNWLQRLVNVLDSKREEARSLAAFHFAMEAGIKEKQGNTIIFQEIGAVDALKKVASSPNAIASKFAAQALQLIGEELPHKLSQQVPLWTEIDVKEWVKQIGFDAYTNEFLSSRVDGDLLLQLTEDMLKEDIGIRNGILRKRFLRELNQLKRMADYTSCDSTYLNQVLQSLGQEFSQYTYQMLRCGVQKETLKYISEDHLAEVCGIDNSIHRLRIAHAIKGLAQQSEDAEEEDDKQKSLDVFVSYRRSNGSQLASLLKVHLQLRGFSVFIDVERLEAGKFDNNLLNSIRQAKHFLLVLTPNALDRCMNDTECKDWVHKEIVEALQSQCNIIPILDNFQWPEPETLPEDMRAVCYFNGVRWIHDYQDACVDKLERFMRGEMNVRSDGPLGRYVGIGGAGTPGTPGNSNAMTNRGNPIYQRSASNDSNKGSTCSDKEINGSNGMSRMSEVSHC
ncbi:NAD(+) hydrolase sarm1-like isoform X3 [Argiope bruennichi]|uniref:NAD(+) hydrolase sarm1-like isoform X3 n=1 Tax=Argiope bruennichi TaxID=94029 RepID=UPI002494CD94|nr:NAD(+) hydrolase sarm1-like isoform X3 [Argiope bruennichi]